MWLVGGWGVTEGLLWVDIVLVILALDFALCVLWEGEDPGWVWLLGWLWI